MYQNDVKLIIHVHIHQTRKGQYRIKKKMRWFSVSLAPVSPQLFLSRYGFRPHVSGESGIRICSPEWKFLNSDILSGDVTRSRPVLYHECCICIQDGNLIPRISLLLALRRMLCCHYFPKSPAYESESGYV